MTQAQYDKIRYAQMALACLPGSTVPSLSGRCRPQLPQLPPHLAEDEHVLRAAIEFDSHFKRSWNLNTYPQMKAQSHPSFTYCCYYTYHNVCVPTNPSTMGA